MGMARVLIGRPFILHTRHSHIIGMNIASIMSTHLSPYILIHWLIATRRLKIVRLRH